EFKRRLCEGSEMMQKMLDDFQRERLEAEAKADKLVNDLCTTPEEIEPITCPQETNGQESEQESTGEEILCIEKPTPCIETYVRNASSEDSDQTFFDSLLDGCDDVCPKDGWNLKSWDELLMSDDEDSSLGEGTIIIIKPQMDSQPIEDKEEINFAIKANDVDLLGRLPPPPTYTESPPYTLLPPSRRDESRILDLDRAEVPTGWHQKRVKRAKLYDSRIGKSRKKWLDPEFDVRKFWQAHGYGRYHSGASIARNWVHPSWRILHHALTHSYLGRSRDSDVVFDSDMLFFWSLEARVPVNLATFVARFLFPQSTSNHQFVLCGPMVTLLARGLCMTVPNVLPEAASIFRPSTTYLIQIAYNKEDKEARPRKQHRIPMTLRELSQAMFAFQDSVDSRLRSMETLLVTQQWQVEEILEYTREQGTKKAEHGAGPKQGKRQG
ncbi:unnamed protein product, partial [Cuscuta campestris]